MVRGPWLGSILGVFNLFRSKANLGLSYNPAGRSHCRLQNYHSLLIIGGEGWLGFPDFWFAQKLWWNWYLTLLVNFGEVRRDQLAKSTRLTSRWCYWDLFRFFKVCQMLKREWGAENNGKLPHLFILSKTATLIPEFAVEDLASAELQPRFLHLQWRTCPWAEHSWWRWH